MLFLPHYSSFFLLNSFASTFTHQLLIVGRPQTSSLLYSHFQVIQKLACVLMSPAWWQLKILQWLFISLRVKSKAFPWCAKHYKILAQLPLTKPMISTPYAYSFPAILDKQSWSRLVASAFLLLSAFCQTSTWVTPTLISGPWLISPDKYGLIWSHCLK